MRIGIIGAAGHFNLALEGMAAAKDITLAGIAPGGREEDITPLARAVSEARVYADYMELLDRERMDIAVVNPWFANASGISVECLRRGISVYSEKPLSTTSAGLEAVERAWRESGCALGGMFNYRYTPWFRAMRDAVDAGEIGEVRMAHGQKSYRLGVRPAFYHERAQMGGIIPWVAIHAIDWALAFLGGCRWVSAAHSAAGNRGNGELEVTSAILMGMESGGIATITADFLRPNASARHDDDRLRLTGTRGMIEVIDGVVALENEQPKRTLTLPDGRSPFLEFVNAVVSGTADHFAQEALAATRVALAARDSADAQGEQIIL